MVTKNRLPPEEDFGALTKRQSEIIEKVTSMTRDFIKSLGTINAEGAGLTGREFIAIMNHSTLTILMSMYDAIRKSYKKDSDKETIKAFLDKADRSVKIFLDKIAHIITYTTERDIKIKWIHGHYGIIDTSRDKQNG